ncbi:MAG: InlB B-repeat-containing protein [bacterium]
MLDIGRGARKIRIRRVVLNSLQERLVLLTGFLVTIFGMISSARAQSTPVTVGYRDFNFGTTVYAFPTSEKPESKLWWNDGHWWGSLWSPATNTYRIHRFEVATQSWVNVGPDIDDRSQSLGDALWDGQKLYVASHIYGGSSQKTNNTTPALSARLYRYSYQSSTKSYSLDSGFPVLVNNAQSETLVLEKDSNGKLWVTWTQAKRVYVNRSLGDDLTWGTPFVIPVQGSNLNGDDISSIISFNDNKIGVIWSNQDDLKCYFAFHLDSKPDTDWEPRETALTDPDLGAVADDHLNLKMTADDGGTLYCVTKTSLGNSNAPSIYMLRRSSSGVWTKYVVANGSDNFTRPIIVIDQENRDLYVFAKSGNSSTGTIRMKKTSIDNPTFASGVGTPFIQSSTERDLNNPTASKHNVDGTTGLLLVAAEESGHYYMHNYITLASNGRPAITSFTPASGVPGTAVTINGSKFAGASVVRFNGVTASFAVNSDAQITATVPSAATTGKIEVTNSVGTGSSASDFTVTTVTTQYTLVVNTVGSGIVALNPPGGIYDAGTVVTLTANPAAGWQFNGWSDDLTGSTNPATITMNANKHVTATFTQLPATQYTMTVNSVGSGSVALNPPGGIYNEGTVVTLTATPASGWQFSGWSGDLPGSTNPATITIDANKNVTATFTVSGPGGLVVHQETITGGSSSSKTVVTSASLTAASGQLYLAAISTKPRIAVSSVSGLGLTWTLVKSQCSGRDQTGIEVWMAQGTPSGNGVVTATLPINAANIAMAVSRYSGVATANPVGSLISGNTTGVNGLCSGGSDNAAYAFNLTTSVGGAMAYGAASMRLRTHTPGAGYTERGEITQVGSSTGSAAGVAVEDKSIASPSTVIVNGTFNAIVDWAVVALEIKPQQGGSGPTQYALALSTAGSGSVALNPPGGVYDAGTVVTLTASPAAGWQFSGWSGDLTGTTNPATITMNANKNVTATFTELPATQYALTVTTAGTGSVDLNPNGGVYNAGTVVTLTANPAAGWQFSGWSGDLTGSNNPATMTMNANKNVTATFTTSGGNGQVVHEETQTGGSTSLATVTTSTNLTAASGHLYLAAISFKSNVGVSNVSGLGLTWTRVQAQCGGRNQTGVEVWMAQGTPSANGAVTATLASTPSNAVIAVSRYSGVDAVNPIGNLISSNTNGANGACSGGLDNNAYAFNLSTIINGAMVYGAAAMRGNTHTPGAEYTERADFRQGSSNSSAASVAVQDKSIASASTVSVNGTFSSAVDWAVVALEIKSQAGVSKPGVTAENQSEGSAPVMDYQLYPNHPNPFNAQTIIEYALPEEAKVGLFIYNLYGQQVRKLVDTVQPSGYKRVRWDGRDDQGQEVGSGIYLIRFEAGPQRSSRQITLLK